MVNIVIVPGWGQVQKCINKLERALHEKFDQAHNVFLFPYDYGAKDVLFGKLAQIDKLSFRLYNFIKDNGLLSPPKSLYFVGYSQGGMVVLYALGKHPELRKALGKFVSIATPHGGAFVDDVRHMIFELYERLKGWFLDRKSFLGPLSAAILEIAEKVTGLKEISAHEDTKFLKEIYPEVCKKALVEIPKEKILEIYSESDLVAPPSSAKAFEDYMNFFQVDITLHEKVAHDDDVIRKVIEFLNGN